MCYKSIWLDDDVCIRKKVASWIDFVLARKMREMVSTEGLGNVRAMGIMLRSATQIN